ncbi:MAG: HAD family phosphatase [Candidatus Marinimicrobia bacterium]|nr:HAD family phosphatase [Candidatus Neomarinimicrobiota bacterium]
MKKTLFLDLGNVILRVQKQVVLHKISEYLNVPADQVEKEIDWDLEMLYEAGKISTAEYIHQINARHEKFTFEILCGIWGHGFSPITETIKLLPKLAETTHLFMLSNTNDIHFTAIEKKYPLSHYFQGLVLSYQLGCRKPEPEIYFKALKIADTPATNAYFVDDLTENITAAQNLGITCHQYQNHEDFYQFLHENSLI